MATLILAGGREQAAQVLRSIDTAVSRGIQPDDAWIGWLLYTLAAIILIRTARLIVRKEFSPKSAG